VRIGAYELEAEIAKALSHPVRLCILELLRDGEQCVCHITAALGLRQPYVSQQLAVLRAADLVTIRKEGLNIYYRVRDERVFDLMDALRELIRQRVEREGRVFTLAPVGERPFHCSCPKCLARQEEMRSDAQSPGG